MTRTEDMMVNDIVMWLQLVIEVSDVVIAGNPEILLLYLALYSNCMHVSRNILCIDYYDNYFFQNHSCIIIMFIIATECNSGNLSWVKLTLFFLQ